MPDSPPPTPPPVDPVHGTPAELQAEVLRLRDQTMGAEARNDVLADRVAELERQVEELAADNRALHAELARNPVVRVARAALRGGRRRR